MSSGNQKLSLSFEGCNLSYQVKGTGEPILLIQGTGIHGDGWLPQVEFLVNKGFQCITFDNRGMGLSQPLIGKLAVDQMAKDALAILNHLAIKSAHIVGHSLGGMIALQLALLAPEKIKTLSLLCTFADGSVVTKLSPWMLWVGIRTRLGTAAMRRKAFLKLILSPDEYQKVDAPNLSKKFEPLFGHDLAESPSVVMKQLAALGKCNLLPQLSQIPQVPTLVVTSQFDRIAPPKCGQLISQNIVNSKYCEISNAAHGLPLTHVDLTNDLLFKHISK